MNKKAWCTCKVFLYCPVHWLHFNRGSKRLFSVEYLFNGEANTASIFLLLAEDYVKFIGRYYLTNSKNAWFLNFRMCLKFFKKSKVAAILNDVTAFRQRHPPPPRWGKVQPFPLYQGGGVQHFAVRTRKKNERFSIRWNIWTPRIESIKRLSPNQIC